MKNRIAGAQISGTWKLNSRKASSIGHKDYGYDKSAEATSFAFPNMAIGKKQMFENLLQESLEITRWTKPCSSQFWIRKRNMPLCGHINTVRSYVNEIDRTAHEPCVWGFTIVSALSDWVILLQWSASLRHGVWLCYATKLYFLYRHIISGVIHLLTIFVH